MPWVLTAVLLAGCVEGYPPQHELPLAPQDMSQAERLYALTQTSQRGGAGVVWRFELQGDCLLQLDAVAPAKAARQLITLKGVYLDMDFDEAVEAFEIGTQPDKSTKTPRTVILKAAAWTDASFAYKILRHLQRDCQLEPEAGA